MNYPTLMLQCAALAAMPLLGCVRADPEHCGNLAGDNTCAEVAAGAYCSACEGANRGCVTSKPSQVSACYLPGDEPFAAGGSSGGGESSSSSSSGGPECMTDGLLDEACSGENPYCVEGVCTSCLDAGETFCADLDPGSPVCAAGVCISCTSDPSVCAQDAWCNTSTRACGGCTEHEQCPDSACEIETGECMPTDMVVYVDNAVCPPKTEPQAVGLGTEQDPFCRIRDATDTVPGDTKATIVIQGGGDFYEQGISVQSPSLRKVAYIGRGTPRLGGVWPGLRIQTSNTVYLHDFYLRGNAEVGLRCSQNSKVWGTDIQISSNGVGITAEGCQIDLARSYVRNNHGDGIVLTEESYLRCHACGLRNNGRQVANTSALHTFSSSFELSYSTIIGNEAVPDKGNQPQASIWTQGSGPTRSIVRNSIVVGDELDSILAPWTDFQFSVLDTTDLAGTEIVVVDSYDSGWWKNSTDVEVSSTNPTPFDGVGVWGVRDPAFDINGPLVRNPGDVTYVGADQNP